MLRFLSNPTVNSFSGVSVPNSSQIVNGHFSSWPLRVRLARHSLRLCEGRGLGEQLSTTFGPPISQIWDALGVTMALKVKNSHPQPLSRWRGEQEHTAVISQTT